jgi:REP element-mobilizing transposase RayT
MTYWRLHYHLIRATFEREPSITPEREKVFYGVLYGKGKELALKIHAAGNIEDHIHVVVSIPPKLAVADCVRHLKGANAYAINHILIFMREWMMNSFLTIRPRQGLKSPAQVMKALTGLACWRTQSRLQPISTH